MTRLSRWNRCYSRDQSPRHECFNRGDLKEDVTSMKPGGRMLGSSSNCGCLPLRVVGALDVRSAFARSVVIVGVISLTSHPAAETTLPASLYLPLPLLLWAAYDLVLVGAARRWCDDDALHPRYRPGKAWSYCRFIGARHKFVTDDKRQTLESAVSHC